MNENGNEQAGSFLVGHRGNLFAIYDDLQFGQSSDNFMSVGCGEVYANGALYVIDKKLSTKTKIKKALETAVHFSGGVRPPFVIKTLKA
jgi:ATP-dependent protease HslVU (ClpYQ) peptidase subunit